MTRTDVELIAAQEYRAACEYLARLRSWDQEIKVKDLHVEWPCGRATLGYSEMTHAVGVLMLSKLPELMVQAIHNAERKVEETRHALLETLQAPR